MFKVEDFEVHLDNINKGLIILSNSAERWPLSTITGTKFKNKFKGDAQVWGRYYLKTLENQLSYNEAQIKRLQIASEEIRMNLGIE